MIGKGSDYIAAHQSWQCDRAATIKSVLGIFLFFLPLSFSFLLSSPLAFPPLSSLISLSSCLFFPHFSCFISLSSQLFSNLSSSLIFRTLSDYPPPPFFFPSNFPLGNNSGILVTTGGESWLDESLQPDWFTCPYLDVLAIHAYGTGDFDESIYLYLPPPSFLLISFFR